MRFVRFGIYRHANCKEIDIEVRKVQFVGPKHVVLRVAYLLRRTREVLGMETAKIVKEQYANWRRVE